MEQEIYLIDNDKEIINKLTNIFKDEKMYKFTNVETSNIDEVLKNIPSLIMINEDTLDIDASEICKKIKENEDNNITPIIVLSSKIEHNHRIQILKQGILHYIKMPMDEEYIYYTIKNILQLLYINRRVSPLTGLPGNVQIQAEMKKRWLSKKRFAVFYFDLDNFKAYNDIYGFLKGDEVIKLTAKTILRNVHRLGNDNSFVGHIGGDDFVVIVSDIDYDKLCQDIISEFDNCIKNYFSDCDVERGYIEVANRRGVIEQFPLTAISIGVVEVTHDRFNNILEIGEAGANVKHLAKTIQGSTYVVDRRKNKED